jgi:hypothetical protein
MKRRRSVIFAATLIGLIAAAGLGRRALEAQAQAQRAEAPIFEVDPLWPKPLPNHWILGSAVGLAIDSRDHIFVLNLTNSFTERTEIGAAASPPTGECCLPAPSILEFDAEGNLVGHWDGLAQVRTRGADAPNAPVIVIDGQRYDWPSSSHGLAIDPQGNIWIGGVGGSDTQILKFSRDGRLLGHVGERVAPPPAAPAGRGGAGGDTASAGRGGGRGGRGGRGGPPPLPPNSSSTASFGGAAEISFDAAANEAFVADGSRNRRVAVIDINTGAIKRFWGAFGNKPDDASAAAYNPESPPSQQFGTPVRCAQLANDGLVYVCDRSNNRIQVFRKNGTFVKEKVIAPRTRGQGSVWDVAFSRDPQQRFLYVADGMNMKVHILDRQSLDVLTSFGDGGRQPGQFYAVHSVATDSRGNLYTTETLEGKRVQKFVFKGVGPVTSPSKGVLWPGPGR